MTKISLLLSLSLLVLAWYAGIAHLAEMIPLPLAQTASDNAGRNVGYRSGETLTPDDQSESKADRSLTQWIRQAMVADMDIATEFFATGGKKWPRTPSCCWIRI
jgi:hypothetical protein